MIPQYDKYAVYIWWCYGLTAAVLIGMLLFSLWRARAVKRELESLDGQRRRASVEASDFASEASSFGSEKQRSPSEAPK